MKCFIDMLMISMILFIAGCLTSEGISYNEDHCFDDLYVTDNTALPCPLCKEIPKVIVSESQLEVHKGFNPPADIKDARHLFIVRCCTTNCLVLGRRVWSWSQQDAVKIWNEAVIPWTR